MRLHDKRITCDVCSMMVHSHGRDQPAAASSGYRRLILVLIIVGAAGLLAELLLIGHFDDPWQWAPLACLAGTLASGWIVAWRPTRGRLHAFQVVMAACVAFGAVGVFLHLKGNLEFELEGTPELKGWPLYWAALRGATPALAPGALAQLGLLGLLFSFRHPAGTPAPSTRTTTPFEESP